MENLTRFLAYAGDFEKTFKDDDWKRLAPCFAEDAVYEVKGLGLDCRLEGPTAIFAGIKKSLDNFDRTFAMRKIEVTSGPDVEGDAIRMGWTVTYGRKGLEPFPLRGRSEVRYRDGKIAYLGDSYDANMEKDAAEWSARNNVVLDARYA
jgi:hypothetical protein